MGALARLLEHDRRLLAGLGGPEEDTLLEGLGTTRQALLEALTAALARGEATVSPGEVAELRGLEAQILEALQARREGVLAELATLGQGRSASAAYAPTGTGVPRYLDRAG